MHDENPPRVNSLGLKRLDILSFCSCEFGAASGLTTAWFLEVGFCAHRPRVLLHRFR